MRSLKRKHYLPLAVAAVVLASLAVDLGHRATRRDRASDLRGLVTQVKKDLASCNASVRDSVAAYTEVVTTRPDERRAALGIIRGDEPSCTPVGNNRLFDLASTETPATLRSFNVQQATVDLAAWAFPNGAAVIADLGQLLSRPADQTVRRDLDQRMATMTRLDRSGEGVFAAAATALHTRVANLDLGSTDRLSVGGL